MQNDGESIRAEVNRRKQRARESGIITSVWKLNEDLRYYDAWAVNCPDLVHPAVNVTSKTEKVDHDDSVERIEVKIRGKSYAFVFREHSTVMDDGEYLKWGHLDVEYESNRVITVDCAYQDDRYAAGTWTTGDVSAFIEGPWVQELNSVCADVSKLHEEFNRVQKERGDLEELEKLKKNFGL
jgi:hypothetical protein